MPYQTILTEAKDDICLITMNNPKTLNALSDVAVEELSTAFDEIESNSNIRVVILTGSGKAFVAGADIGYMSNLTPEEARVFARDTCRLYEKIRVSKKIYIAAINGFALGGGCEFALACDLRIASEKARFGLPEVSLGILPGGAGTQRLPRLVGTAYAKEMIFTGDTIKAEEAKEIGLISKVTSSENLLTQAFELANRILKNSPLAVQYAKECIRQSEELPLQNGIEHENTLFGLCFAASDQREGMKAFLEKRKPDFQKGF